MVEGITSLVNRARKDKSKMFTSGLENRDPYLRMLDNSQIQEIRELFYKTNAYLFKNYEKYVKQNENQTLELDIEKFINEESGGNNDLKEFYKKYFKNEYFDEREYKKQLKEKKKLKNASVRLYVIN